MSNSGNNKNKRRQNKRLKPGITEQIIQNDNTDVQVEICRISRKGNGVGLVDQQDTKQSIIRELHVPNTLPGEIVRVRPIKKLGKEIVAELIELIVTSPERELPKCNSFPNCGGCKTQQMNYNYYLDWKKSSTLALLQKSKIEIGEFTGLIASEEQKRRRASFKFKRTKEKSYIGFYKSRSHQIIQLDGCAVLSSDLLETKQIILEGLDKTMPIGAEISVHVNQYETGSDVLLISEKKVSNLAQVELAKWASNTKIQRISICYNGERQKQLIYQHSPPSITWGGFEISPPPGSFLQPTLFGEKILQKQILSACKDMNYCLDLFAGTGTLSANLLAQKVRVTAIDNDEECLNAYKLGYQRIAKNNYLKTEKRNLMEAPLLSDYLNNFDGIILDPPRAGALSQVKQIAMSVCPSVTYVSCNPFSFINDAKILMQRGYRLKEFTILDQFSWTTHSEIIGNFKKE